MNRPQQEFTFINVNAGRRTNTRTIKRHVSNQTNRRKRQEAVTQYQQSLLKASDQFTPPREISPPLAGDEKYESTFRSQITPAASICSSSASVGSPQNEDVGSNFEFYGQLAHRPAVQIEGFWPTYQRWLERNIEKSTPPPRTSPTEVDSKKPKKTWRVSYSPAQSGIFVSNSDDHTTIHIPRINSPSEHSHMEWALKTCAEYIRGNYETTWKDAWQHKKWYQGTLLPLGIWRECFPLSVEFIQAGRMQDAFYILNAALATTPAFFKQNHPGLLIAILGAFMYTCQISDERLSSLIRTHVTQLSIIHLGPHHPISMLLREQMRSVDDAQGRTDLLAIAVMDTFAEVFGPTHYMSHSMRFGYVRRQLSVGDYDAALSSIAKLEKVWNAETMPAMQLPKFLAFEKAKIVSAQRRAKGITDDGPGGLQSLTKMAEDSIQLPVFIPGYGPALATTPSAILKRLGKHLLMGSHYALALYIYTRIPEVFASGFDPNQSTAMNQDPETLPKTVARILINRLQNEMKNET